MAAGIKARPPRAARVKQILPVTDLTGGLDLRRSETLLAPDRARSLKNFSLEEPGALIVRPGYQRTSTITWFNGRPQGGQRVYLANSAFTLIAGEGKVFKPSDAWGGSTSPVYSTLSTGNHIFFPYDRDLAMVMDGANRPRFTTNGTDWHLAGTDAPSSGATLSSVSTGGLSSGEIAVIYTYKHRGTAHESNPSPASTITLSASSGAVHATASPSTDPKNDAYVWYARKVLPDLEGVYRKYSSGAASTVTIASSAWTSNDEAPSNHDVPPTGLRFGVSWKSRWWAPSGRVGNRLHFTELFQPQSYPSLFFIDIPFEKGDSITALQPLGDTLLVFGQSGVFLIIGQTSLDFEVRPSQGGETGAFGQRAVAKVEQAALHAGGDGVNSFDGAGDRSLEHDIATAWSDLVQNTGSTDLAHVAALYDHQRQEVRLAVPRVYPTGARGELVLNLDRTRENRGTPAWCTTDRDIALYMHWNGNEPTAGNRGRIFSMPSTVGVVDEEVIEVGANSSNLAAEYESPTLSLGLHRARVTELHVEYEPNGGALAAEVTVDGITHGPYTLPTGAGLATYDADDALYDTSNYAGSGRRKAYQILPLEAEGRTASVRLTYTGTDRQRLFTFALGILPESGVRQVSE
ncbi:MAG TPA: hypothetical protein VEC39_01760 [Vicinamibacterales bacterium]|nr:hypothetical protein [Vicinamibacterales bacterium]